MADIKRLHYFDHQFLVEADFSDEQTYHLDMRRRHNRDLHTFGVAAGLQVEKTGDKEVTVSAGTAVDREGRQVVLDTDQIIDLSTFSAGDVFITIAYDEQETDPTTATGVTGNTRVMETPQIQAINVPPDPAPPGDGSVIRLANFTLSGGGNVPGSNGDTFDAGLRQFAGSSIAPNSVGTGELADGAVTEDKIADNAITAAKITDLSISAADLANRSITEPKLADDSVSNRTIESLAVTGNKIASNAITTSKIAAGAVNTADIANNAVAEGNMANNAVSNRTIQNLGVTGTKIAENTIAESKLNSAARGKLVTNGNAHDHSGGDGAQIRHSTLNKDDGRNPHGTNAADVGALSTGGGSISGSLAVSTTSGYSSYFRAGQPYNGVRGGVGQTTLPGGWVAGVEGQAFGSSGYGVAARSDTGGYSLYVSGTAFFSGAKTGYVVDCFINTSGRKLTCGDIVKLKGTPIARFKGDGNKIPLAEVTLADTENDPKIIGIVDREAIPEQDDPDERVEPDDPTFVADGGELYVVTLGTYAHCKVDASEEPIAVGDLLTSSSKPGFAKKAIEPKIGSIIGKALESLKEGTGYISVFVNIQ